MLRLAISHLHRHYIVAITFSLEKKRGRFVSSLLGSPLNPTWFRGDFSVSVPCE